MLTKSTVRSYRSLMRRLWLKIKQDPENATETMWGRLRYFEHVCGCKADSVPRRGRMPKVM